MTEKNLLAKWQIDLFETMKTSEQELRLKWESIKQASVEADKNTSDVKSFSTLRYDGFMKNGLFHGQGTKLFLNGDIYTGQWENGEMHGFGKYEFTGEIDIHNRSRFVHYKIIYEGEFTYGEQTGFGKTTYSDDYNYQYIGHYKNGKRHGYGIHTDFNGCESYSGDWIDDQQHGKFIWYRFAGLPRKQIWEKNCLIQDLNTLWINDDEILGFYVGDKYEGNDVVFNCTDGCKYEGTVQEGQAVDGIKTIGDYQMHYKNKSFAGYSVPDGKKYNWWMGFELSRFFDQI